MVSDKEATKNGVDPGVFELSLNKYDKLCHSLKHTIFNGVMRSSDVSVYELRGEVIIKSLFYLYAIDERNSKCQLLPMEYRPKPALEKDDEDKLRYQRERIQNSIDYIAGMMDTYAIKEYQEFFSVSFNSISLDQVKVIDNSIKEEENIRVDNMTIRILQSNNNKLMELSESKVHLHNGFKVQ